MRAVLMPRRRWLPARIEGPPAWQPLLLSMTALLVFLITYVGLGGVFGTAALGALAVAIVWFRPLVGMVALLVLGASHQFLMLLLFHLSGTVALVKFAQVWKEVVVVALLAKAIDLAFRRRTPPRLHLLDLGILIFLAYGLFYLLYPSSLDESSLVSTVMGLRADAFFLLAYFVGRGIPITGRQLRVLLTAFAFTASVVVAVAFLQFLAPVAFNTFFENLSFAQYMEVQRGDQAVRNVIRENFISGVVIPRASSLFLSDLGLAFYTLLAVPLWAALFFTLPGLRAKLIFNLLLLATVATTVLTVTRSAMMALVPAFALVMLAAQSFLPGVLVALQIGGAVAIVAVALNITPGLLQDIFSLREASAMGHVSAISESLKALQAEPFGRGLGTAGQIGQRFTPTGGITNESWYLQIATEMGVIAAIIFALLLLGFGTVAALQYRQVRQSDPWVRALCLGMLGATVGFGLVGLTLHVWEGLTVSIMFWLLAGIVVRAASIDSDREEAQDADRSVA